MDKKEKIHQLAIYYFEGRIPLEDEKILFAFISQSEENRAAFYTWEKDWTLSTTEEKILQKEWELLQGKIHTRSAINQLLNVKRFPVFKRIAAVATVAIISIATTLVVQNQFFLSPDKNSFIVETPRGGKNRIILPDGTLVWLNSSSKISYTSQFGNSERELELDGEAYFEVAKQEIPFRVKTSHYEVVVKGTKFNISSYQNDETSTTTLMEGKVEVVHQDSVLEMKPGESMLVDKRTRKLSRTDVNPKQYKSWIENKIEYDAITSDELFKRLSRQYDVNISFEPVSKGNRMLNISIQNDETIDEILNGISEVIPIKIEKRERSFYIKPK